MNLIYDHLIFNRQQYGGISRYHTELMRYIGVPYRLSVLVHNNYYLSEARLAENSLAVPRRVGKIFMKQIKQVNTAYLKYLLRHARREDTIYHSTGNTMLFEAKKVPVPLVVTIHDLTPELFPQFFANPAKVMEDKYEMMQAATRIIAITEQTKGDIISHYGINPAKIDVVYHGVSGSPTTDIPNLPENYLLFVGERDGYKNFSTLLRAFALIATDHPSLHLFATGKHFSPAEEERISDLGIRDRVIARRVSDAELSTLYSRAQMLVFPSLYEGFGLPILEAFAQSCPVVLSRASCFPEIAGSAAAFFDPLSAEDLAESIHNLLSRKEQLSALATRGKERVIDFSWQRTARETQAVYVKALCSTNL